MAVGPLEVQVARLRRSLGTTARERHRAPLNLELLAPATIADSSVPEGAEVDCDVVLESFDGGIVVTGANALVSGVSEAHRATALNLVNLFFGLGGFATPFVSANLFKRNWVRLCYTVASLTVVALIVQALTHMPGSSAGSGFVLSQAGPVLGRPMLFLLGLFLFLYITCEVGVWNWLPRHLIAQGIAESRALNILSLGFALGLLVGRVGVSPILNGPTVTP